MVAKAALQELNFSSDEETESHTDIFEDTDSDSNTSDSTEYFSDADSNTSWLPQGYHELSLVVPNIAHVEMQRVQ